MTTREIDSLAREMTGIFRDHRLDRTGEADIHALSLDQAYEVQKAFLAARIKEGERPVGYKIGCTSPAIRAQFGLEGTAPFDARKQQALP